MTTTNTAMQDRAARAKGKRDEPKADKKATTSTKPETKATPAPTTISNPKPGDQKDAPKTDTPVKEPKEKKARKVSDTVLEWKKLENFPETGVITVLADYATNNPKRRDAARRFSWYKSGQTVADYLKLAKEGGVTAGAAHGDIRWDVAAGFISIK